MALVRDRRQVNLTLSNIAERRPCLPLIIPPQPSIKPSSSVAFNELEKLKVLGHGNGGTVYKVRNQWTSQVHALKLINGSSDAAALRNGAREVEILRRTNSPHVVHCHDAVVKPSGDIAILMEYMEGGSLATLLRDNGPFSEPVLARVAHQVLSGIGYLHGMKIAHRDIKPSNLLVTGDLEIKIADFGVSKLMGRTLDSCNSYVGTCAYMSPERFNPDAYDGNYNAYAGDVWSLGLTLLELYLGHFPLLPPGQRPDWTTLMFAICLGERPALPDGVSDVFRSFLECCLEKDAERRWTVTELLSHPFLQSG